MAVRKRPTGSDPTPTPEQREARIAQLRARRRSRARWLAVRGAITVLAVFVIVLLLGWWVLSTVGGRDFLLNQISARLPTGTELTWAKAEGPVQGPMILHDVRFVSRGCPALNEQPVAYPNCKFPRTTTFSAKRVAIDPALRPLLGKTLRLDMLELSDATLDLPDSDEPFELPKWPDVLPQIAPPLALQADAIRIDRLKVTRQREPVIDLRSVRGGLNVNEGSAQIRQLVVDSDLGRFTVHGDYASKDNYRTNLTATAVFAGRAGRAVLPGLPPRIGLVARGDLSKMDVGIAGAVPKPLRASLTLRDAELPKWTLRANTSGLDLAALTGGEASPTPMTFDLRADGTGGNMRVRGQFEQGPLRAVIQPSTLQLNDQVLAFAPLTLDIFDGQIIVRGSGDFGDRGSGARIRYAVNARGLRFGAAPTATPADPAQKPAQKIAVDADLGIAGTRAAWAAVGNARIERAGEHATVRLDGRGDAERLRLRTLQANMPSGTLDASGQIGWAPTTQWTLKAALAGFDPSYFAPDWNGQINGVVTTEGRVTSGSGLEATATLTDLGGQLRGRALRGHANVKATGDTYRGDLLLGVGKGELKAKGQYTSGADTQWQADAVLRDFDPGLVLTDWPGAIDATLSSVGKRRADGGLDIRVDAERLGGDLRQRAMSGRGNVQIELPSHGEPRLAGDIAIGMGGSRVEAKGRVTDVLAVDASLQPLQLNDFLPDASGTLRGTLRLTGARNAPSIDADLTGGELRYGTYQVQSLTAKGRLPWQGDTGNLAIRAQGLAVGTAIDSLRVDARGAMENLQLDGEVQAEMGRVALTGSALKRGANWNGALERLQLVPARGASWQLAGPARYAQNGSNWSVSRSCFTSSEGGSLCIDADWPQRGLNLDGKGLPLALANAYLPADEHENSQWLVNGEIDLDAQLRPQGNAWTGRVLVRSAQGGLRDSARARRDLIGYRDLTMEADFNPQRILGTLATGIASGDGDSGRLNARIATGWDAAAPLSGEIALDTKGLTWLELFSPDIVDPTGTLSGRISLSGTRAAPALGGQARLTGFRAEVPSLNIVLEQGDVRMNALPDGSARITGAVRSGAGTLNVDGSLNWRGGDTPLIINLRGENFLASDTRDVHAVINPDLAIRMQTGQPLSVTGTVTVPKALLGLERLGVGVSASNDVVVLDPVHPEKAPTSPLALDLTLALGNDVALNGFGLEGKLGGRLRVRAMPGREMTGSGRLDVEGRYEAYGQDLKIARGHLLWSNSAIGDPILDVRAEREIGAVIAGVAVTGRASAPEANVYSNQSISQSDALAYLTLGRPLSGLSSEQASDVNAASAALTAGGGVLASQLGSKIGLDEAGVMQSRTAGSVFGVGKYLSPRVYVGYGVSLLGTGQVMMLKYLLRKGFDVQIESSSIENRGSVNWRMEK